MLLRSQYRGSSWVLVTHYDLENFIVPGSLLRITGTCNRNHTVYILPILFRRLYVTAVLIVLDYGKPEGPAHLPARLLRNSDPGHSFVLVTGF